MPKKTYPGKESSNLPPTMVFGCYEVIALAHRAHKIDCDIYLVKTTCCGTETTRARNSLNNAARTEQKQCMNCMRKPTKKSYIRTVEPRFKPSDFSSIPWGAATKPQTW